MIKFYPELDPSYVVDKSNIFSSHKWLSDDDMEKVCSLPGGVAATFKNGNQLIDYSLPNYSRSRSFDLFSVITPDGEFLCIFQGYEAMNPFYVERADVFIVPGHDDVKVVFSDGTYEQGYVR